MARIVTISSGKEKPRGVKRAVKAVAPRIDKRFKGSVEDWIDSGEWIRVKSSNVAKIMFERSAKKLWVEFKGGSTYFYQPISVRQAKDFFGTPSFGKHIWRMRRAGYVGIKS